MLDCFEIVTSSGVLLWSRSNSPLGVNVVNSLINDAFIEEKVRHAGEGQIPYRYEKHTVKYTHVKDLGLIFVAVYQSILSLTWVETLLDNLTTLFVQLYKDQLIKPNANIREYDFDRYYDQQILDLEEKNKSGTTITNGQPDASVGGEKKEVLENGDTGGPPPPKPSGHLKTQPSKAASFAGDSNQSSPIQTPETSRPTTPIPNHLLTAKGGPPGGRGSRRSRKAAANASPAMSSGDESKKGKTKSQAKKMRKWDADGMAAEDDNTVLDYSTTNGAETNGNSEIQAPPLESIQSHGAGSKTSRGEFILKDLDDEVNSILSSAKSKSASQPNKSGVVTSSLGAISGYFRNIVGGKTLTEADLAKPLKEMEAHLINKNVARSAAVRLCDGISRELVGHKTGSFESIDSALRTATEAALSKILTPTSSLDLLREIRAVTSPSTSTHPRPYVISIVGVNGVGKSTNLSKLAWFLLQNNYRILIAACDTFRSGAVEQLNVHVRNLREYSEREQLGGIDLYQRGYGKDAANVAKDAVAYAAANAFDIVLIDTAGRRHNDQRLMSSLEKFAKLAKPDLAYMVGEALAGNDSVAQAHNFNEAFGPGRNLDGFIISKCDTVGDMVGTLVSMVHATGIPIVFLGIGQQYGDLRTLSVPWAVECLMRN
ncbi:MAG: hypothetical protein Q9160_000434 [Pyrenula sp. 1 TL-2023]